MYTLRRLLWFIRYRTNGPVIIVNGKRYRGRK